MLSQNSPHRPTLNTFLNSFNASIPFIPVNNDKLPEKPLSITLPRVVHCTKQFSPTNELFDLPGGGGMQLVPDTMRLTAEIVIF